MGRLDGKTALVTGIGEGNGSHIARTFAREGADLVLVTLPTSALEETVEAARAMGRQVVVVQGDVGHRNIWEQAREEANATFGKVDIVVNNAATGRVAHVLQVTEEQWDETQRNNVKSVYYSFQTFIPQMAERGGGVFVNISSVNGNFSSPLMVDYAASKWAMQGLTRNVAVDFGAKGIRANCIAPGIVVSKTYAEYLKTDPEETRGILDNYLLNRWGEPQDIANAALFLASDESSFITGVILPVDGGLTIQTVEGNVRKSFRARWREDKIQFVDA